MTDTDHLACPSYPNCDEDPLGCRLLTADVEEYGHRDKTVTDITDLVEKLESAPERSEELNVAITRLLCNYGPDDPLWYTADWTGSLDAKLPWEDIVTVIKTPDGFRAEHIKVDKTGDFECFHAEAHTEPLARRAAALRGKV